MAGKLGNLLVTIAGDVSQLRKDMDRASGIVDSAMREIEGAVSLAKKAFLGLGAGLSVGAFAAFAKAGIDTADSMNQLAAKTGLAIEDLSKYAYAARQADLDQGQLAGGLQKFATLLTKAQQGLKSAQDTLARLGVTRFDDFNAAILQAADGVARLGKGREQIALLREAFGRGGANFAQMFEGGAAGLKAFADEAERTGNVISAETGAAADEFKDRMESLRQTIEGAQIQLGNYMLPTLNAITKAFVDGAREGGAWEAIFRSARAGIDALFGQPVDRMITNLEDRITEVRERIQYLEGNGGTLSKFDAFWNHALGKDGAVQSQIFKLKLELGGLLEQLDQLKDVKALDKPAANAEGKVNVSTTTDPEAERKAREEAERLAKQRQQKIDDVVKALQFENEQFLRTADAQKVYQELQKAGVDLTSREGQQIAELVAKRTINEKSLKAEAETKQWLAEIEQEDLDRRDKAKSLTESLRTPQEALNASIAEYLSLLEDGLITQDTYVRGVNKAIDDMEAAVKKQNGLDDRTKQLAKGAEDLGLTFVSAFEDATLEAQSFGDVMEGLGKDIARIFQRVLITQPLTDALSGFAKNLFGGAGGGGGGGGASAGGGFIEWAKGLFGFAQGGAFTVGGSGGTDSQVVAFRATPGEEVRVGPAGFSGGGANVSFTIVANDARGFDDLLARRRQMIVGMVQQAFDKNAKRGIK